MDELASAASGGGNDRAVEFTPACDEERPERVERPELPFPLPSWHDSNVSTATCSLDREPEHELKVISSGRTGGSPTAMSTTKRPSSFRSSSTSPERQQQVQDNPDVNAAQESKPNGRAGTKRFKLSPSSLDEVRCRPVLVRRVVLARSSSRQHVAGLVRA